MNDQLIKFIELCLVDGVISDKEREVIFRKAEQLGVPKDECEIILEGMFMQKAESSNQPVKQTNEKDSTEKSIPGSIVNELVLTSLICLAIIYFIAVSLLFFYNISRQTHNENLRSINRI